jgi:hypothetical protein
MTKINDATSGPIQVIVRDRPFTLELTATLMARHFDLNDVRYSAILDLLSDPQRFGAFIREALSGSPTPPLTDEQARALVAADIDAVVRGLFLAFKRLRVAYQGGPDLLEQLDTDG